MCGEDGVGVPSILTNLSTYIFYFVKTKILGRKKN